MDEVWVVVHFDGKSIEVEAYNSEDAAEEEHCPSPDYWCVVAQAFGPSVPTLPQYA